MAPIILELEKRQISENAVAVTGQQRGMLDQVLGMFDISTDHDLDIMVPNQSLEHITTTVLEGIGEVLNEEKPNFVIVQGDTTTAFAAGLAAFYAKIPVAYVESGLRTDNLYNPFPEEMNRRLLSHLAQIHFAPTQQASKNLLKEGIDPQSVHITGNTVVDALMLIAGQNYQFKSQTLAQIDFSSQKVILLTSHRRENLGEPMKRIFSAVREVASKHSGVLIVFPVHPNPLIKELAENELGQTANIRLIEPLDYTDLVLLLKNCYMVLTDSGGIQEEAPTFGKPVLVLRDSTERPEGITTGVAKLVGTDKAKIVAATSQLITDTAAYQQMAKSSNPYGDGTAAKQIVDILLDQV